MNSITTTDKIELSKLIKNLEEFKEKIKEIDYIHNKEGFFLIMKKFRKFLTKIEDNRLCNLFFHSRYYKSYENFFREKNNYYIRAIEAVEAISIITRGNHHGVDNFIDIIDREHIKARYAKKVIEIECIDFSQAKKLVMVGCGPMPETMLYLYENTNLEKITGLDNNYEAIYIAGELVRSLGLNKISLQYKNGLTYNYKDADVIIIPAFVYPKEKVLDRIVETGKNNVQILMSSVKHLGKMLYDDVTEINPRLKIEKISKIENAYYKMEKIKLVKYDI